MTEFVVSPKKEEREEKKRAKIASSSASLRERIIELEQELTNKDKLIEKISLIVGKLTVELELNKIER